MRFVSPPTNGFQAEVLVIGWQFAAESEDVRVKRCENRKRDQKYNESRRMLFKHALS